MGNGCLEKASLYQQESCRSLPVDYRYLVKNGDIFNENFTVHSLERLSDNRTVAKSSR
jgi:hypothetical protein